MFQFNMTTRTDGVQAVRRRFQMLDKATPSVLQQVAKDEIAATQQRIRQTKVDPDGHAWAPWAFATLRQRQRERNTSRGLLYRTGALLNSIQARVSEKTLTIFSNVGYARYLQFGTNKMPARRFLGWSQASINRIKQLIRETATK